MLFESPEVVALFVLFFRFLEVLSDYSNLCLIISSFAITIKLQFVIQLLLRIILEESYA